MCAHAGPVDHQSVNVMRVGDGVHDPVPVACVAPPVEAIIDRCRWAIFAKQIGPRDAGVQDVENAVDHAAVINPLLAARFVRQDRFGEFSFQIAPLASSRPLFGPNESQTYAQKQELMGMLPSGPTLSSKLSKRCAAG